MTHWLLKGTVSIGKPSTSNAKCRENNTKLKESIAEHIHLPNLIQFLQNNLIPSTFEPG
jgi:hypothetical protein